MDNQKDFYIKCKFQEDDLISKKADDVFNNFLKGEIKMENEKLNVDEKVVNINDAKDKKLKRKKILSIVATLMVVFLGANVYAATQGYNNIFFIIKNLVSTEVVTDRNEILSDKDLTISYQPIEIAENLSMQINKLIVKENEATLTIKVDEIYPLEHYPAKFVIYDITENRKEILGNEKNKVDRVVDIEGISYVEEIELDNIKNDTTKLQFEVFDQNDEKIAVLEIDLENKEIDVLSSKSTGLEKISEIELKEILGCYANFLSYYSFNAGDYMSRDEFLKEKLVEQAMLKLLEKDDYQTRTNNEYSIKEVHTAIEEICGIYYEEPIILEYSLIYYNKEKGCYSWDNGDGLGPALCLNITDISFQNGIYTVEFVYCFAGELSYLENEIEDLDKFKATLELSINEDYEYFKYRIINFGKTDGESYYIQEKEDNVSSDIDIPNNSNENTNPDNSSSNNSEPNSGTIDNIDNNIDKESHNSDSGYVEAPIDKKVDNYASSMIWTELYTPGLKTRVPADWNVEVLKARYSGEMDNLKPATRVSGLAQGINRETNQIINSNMKITFYMPDMMKNPTTLEEYSKKIADLYGAQDSGGGYSDGTNLTWREARKINGDAETYYYTHIEMIDNGTSCIGYLIEIDVDYSANYKVTNIMNWIFGDIKTTSF